MNEYKRPRRLKRLEITTEFVDSLISGDVGIVAGLPEDARVVSMEKNATRQTMTVIIYSSEYDEVMEGETIPVAEAMSIGLPVGTG